LFVASVPFSHFCMSMSKSNWLATSIGLSTSCLRTMLFHA
jgi:hypothetical protein